MIRRLAMMAVTMLVAADVVLAANMCAPGCAGWTLQEWTDPTAGGAMRIQEDYLYTCAPKQLKSDEPCQWCHKSELDQMTPGGGNVVVSQAANSPFGGGCGVDGDAQFLTTVWAPGGTYIYYSSVLPTACFSGDPGWEQQSWTFTVVN